MSIVIWHNPRCSKSREALALIRERGFDPEIRQYLSDPPSRDELVSALSLLGMSALDLLRRGEREFREAGLSKDSSEDDAIVAMLTWPKLIERPIVFANGKARVGRPPSDVLEILGS